MKVIYKYRFEIIIFIVDAIYMILELIASRLLSPYFGNSNLVWTSIIGIILLSNSLGNYLGGIAADKKEQTKLLRYILLTLGLVILVIPLIQTSILRKIISFTSNIKIGAIFASILLFFIPSTLIGIISPIVIKLKMKDLKNVGKTSGTIYAISTLGGITGTFMGGFFLIPSFGSSQILFVLAIIVFILFFFLGDMIKNKKIIIYAITAIIVSGILFGVYFQYNEVQGAKVLENDVSAMYSCDTEYGRVNIYNSDQDGDLCRYLRIGQGSESATYVDEDKCYDLVYEYTKYYDLMFKANIDINDTLMIGGAGYSYPKYYISQYHDKNMDVVEIDGKVLDIAKKYLYLDKLIEEFDLEKNDRLGLIIEDGRVYLNQNTKKYDAILNDAFSGYSPEKTLTTVEALEKIHESLNKNGVYLTNIISSIDGENSKFLKAEVNTLKQVFENVYIIPCNDTYDYERQQNIMVIATDDTLDIEENISLNFDDDTVILTDNYCPVETLIPQV